MGSQSKNLKWLEIFASLLTNVMLLKTLKITKKEIAKNSGKTSKIFPSLCNIIKFVRAKHCQAQPKNIYQNFRKFWSIHRGALYNLSIVLWQGGRNGQTWKMLSWLLASKARQTFWEKKTLLKSLLLCLLKNNRLYSVYKENPEFPRNMLAPPTQLSKNSQFLLNLYETWSKWLSHLSP